MGRFFDMPHVPSAEILERYGEVMVSYGLGNGAGIKPGEVVGVVCPEDAKPLLLEVARAVWRAGGHLIVDFRPADDAEWNLHRAFYEIASDEQLEFFPDAYRRSYFAAIDHYLGLLAYREVRSLAGVDPEKRSRHLRSAGRETTYWFEKVKAGTLSWSGGLYGTEALAAEAGMSLEEYWQQIIEACFLDDPDPVSRWRATAAEIRQTVAWLNRLDIERLHIEADGTDLWVTVGEQRRWAGGESVNVPSFEIATSPDWRGTEGHIAFSEPLFRNGEVIRGIRLTFAGGEVVQSSADEGGRELKAMIATDPGAARIGEYSLTDGRHSPITRFMATTLYDENRGGPTGNTHLALGTSMEEMCYAGDVAAATPEQLAALGFNTASSIHVDIISTSERTITATLKDGSTEVIYRGGQFQNG
jgi:aminopeptidase